MTLTELAALLDSLKRPIEEAPRDGRSIFGMYSDGYTERLKWNTIDGCWQDARNNRCYPSHFLPLSAADGCAFHVVPRGLVEEAYFEGLNTGRCDPKVAESSLMWWSKSTTKQKLEANNA